MAETSNLCPCCSGLLYAKCCEPLHKGQEAPTPLLLMRSRYSAYALGRSDYIQKTTHTKSKYFEDNKTQWNLSILEFCRSTKFEKLEILDSRDNWVSFAAHLKQGGKLVTLFEKSYFEKEGSCWRYVNGETRIERN